MVVVCSVLCGLFCLFVVCCGCLWYVVVCLRHVLFVLWYLFAVLGGVFAILFAVCHRCGFFRNILKTKIKQTRNNGHAHIHNTRNHARITFSTRPPTHT